jgi:hypothetical protein
MNFNNKKPKLRLGNIDRKLAYLPGECSTGMRPPGWGSWGTRPPRPRDGGTPGGTFPHVPFLGRRGGTWGDATPQGGGRDSPKGGLLDVPP